MLYKAMMAHFRVGVSAVVVGFSIVVAGNPAVAQDSLQVDQQPTRHVVQEGETLWGLAALYFGDPFLWPQIYRLNTGVVEDPHWIFPGEELTLIMIAPQPVAETQPEPVVPAGDFEGQEQAAARPGEPPPEVAMPETPPPPPPVASNEPTVFQPPRQAEGRAARRGPQRSAVRAVRRFDFYAAGFLTEEDDLPWGELIAVGEAGQPSGGVIRNSATIFERIRLRAPDGATYQVGDTLLLAELPRDIPRWGDVVLPSGLAKVIRVSGRDAVAEVVAQFHRVSERQVAMPVEPFTNPVGRPAAVENGFRGTVIDVRDRHPVPGLQDILFIDLGRSDGVQTGDIFEVLVAPGRNDLAGSHPQERVAVVRIVHVRERSASGMLTQLAGHGIRPGVPVRLIGKMPS